MKKVKKKLIITWTEKPLGDVRVKFAACGSNCYSGTCDSCRNI